MLMDTLSEYTKPADFAIREAGIRRRDGIMGMTLTYQPAGGPRRAAYFISPEADGVYPAILYVHWYEPTSLDSNRTQFLEEAEEMARRGACSLLVETMWSDRDWFIKRTQDDDIDNSLRQVAELRQALDVLTGFPQVDGGRVAYVGHDFGAMYGVLAGSVDGRPACYVLMAGTPRFPEWYLYYPAMEEKAQARFREQMAPLDPIRRVAALAPAPVLFQFADNDPHVPADRAKEFFAAAADPKEIRWYNAGHSLNQEAREERIAWLASRLGLA